MNPSSKTRPPSIGGLLLFASLALVAQPLLAATGKIKISKATWSAKTGKLLVKGNAKNVSGPVEIFDVNGRRLGEGKSGSFTLTLTKAKDDLPLAPCAVRVQAGSTEAVKAVVGAPPVCAKPPVCSIAAPAAGSAVNVRRETSFQATFTDKAKNSYPVRYEWDFAGGAMERPRGTLSGNGNVDAKATFVRDNSRYRVRFSATDNLGRRCEDAVDIVVGIPPNTGLAKVAEQPAAKLGSELGGDRGDVVVLPFEEWTYQNASDMKLAPNGYSSFSPVANSIQAYAYKKDRLPVLLADEGENAVTLRYSAASNPSDPVPGSINSTSRNWPTTATLTAADIQKTDMWEIPSRPDAQKSPDYFACSWAMTGYWSAYGCNDAQGFPLADEGYFKAKKDTAGNVVPNDPNTINGHGAYMPGKDAPYQSNNPQPFSRYDLEATLHEANLLPYTDIDDQGRVNPYSVLRVEAVAKGTNNVVAKTDGVVSASRDFHCRECHTKGEVGANPNAPHTKAAFASSAWGKYAVDRAQATGSGRYYIPEDKKPEKPVLFDVSDIGGDPNSIFDQEYAAALNYSSMHQFYDAIPFLNEMKYAIGKTYVSETDAANPSNIAKDTPRPCYGCHATAISFTPFESPWWDEEGFKVNDTAYAPNYSITMHRFHAELQWNSGKTDIVRDEKGAFVRWDYKTKGPNNSTQTGSLFPIFDANGNQLPMEENCLKCHSGHREQLYRDRMYTAGVTCFDCHGDMLAVGEAFPKNYLQNKAKLGSVERDDYRVPWYDEPDCGSCHIGDGNQGADKANGFFSAGVKKTAFDLDDWSATTRRIDRNSPESSRFAVAPKENYIASFPTDFYYDVIEATGEFPTKTVQTKVDAPVFRYGKDTHGNVACAACHGAAHSIWPNRDPSANDNVTALQLQGHTGNILECEVCHTKDSFKELKDLDGGRFMTDLANITDFHGGSGVLGGPHNMHPVNDPNWWKKASGNTDVADDTGNSGDYGGWHNDIAKRPGKNGEDQCAACHGDDHKGTRLSKTPVDRVFDFSKGFNFAKLKKAGFKKKVIKVAAGTPIGCDTCHSLETSRLK